MVHTDICIAGAGIIGLSLALELHARGLGVTVVEARLPLREASTAAAGMLAADDPHNPAELSPLAHRSVALYPEFLRRLQSLSGIAVPFQTSFTLQSVTDTPSAPLDYRLLTASDGIAPPLSSGFALLRERSLDPRQLASALLTAVASTTVHLLTGTPVLSTLAMGDSVAVSTSASAIEAARFVDCTGAWTSDPAYTVFPIKGQMLALALPAEFPMRRTLRTRDIYIVPRTAGPNAGRAIVGATVEDAGFDRIVHTAQIEDLRRQAIALVPELAHAPVLESWSGLRPATADRLPLIGPHPTKPRHWIATGHFRNGILLAPATARIMTQLLLNETPSLTTEAFSPSRPMASQRQSVFPERS
jgi:glycine oxidase